MAGLFGLIPIYYDLLVERVGNKKDEFGTSYASMPCVDIPARGNFAVAVVGLVVKHNVFFAVKKIKVSNTFPAISSTNMRNVSMPVLPCSIVPSGKTT